MIRSTPLLSRLLCLLVFGLAPVVAQAAPAWVIIRTPADRPAPAGLGPLLARWRLSGLAAGVLYLTDGRSEKPERRAKFGALAVLEFADEAAAGRWEREAAPLLPAGLTVRRADVLAHGELAPPGSVRSVYVVNTYTPLVPAAQFAGYVAGYVQPLYEAMRGTGHLVSYTAYLERGETGRVDALNVLEYRDPAALAAMGALKTGLRERLLATHPTYPRFDQIKDTLRLDGFGTLATGQALPVPAGN